MAPTPPAVKYAGETAPGFEKVANPAALDDQFGNAPVQPGNKSCVWGDNSFVRLPAFGGEVRVELRH